VFAHPFCPCTRATFDELEKILAQAGDGVVVHVVMAPIDDPDEGGALPESFRRAQRIPGVDVRWDAGGGEARRFGAHTSGQVLLYDAAGQLAFQGGMTPARGEAGDNAGESRLAGLFGKRPADARTSRPTRPRAGRPASVSIRPHTARRRSS